jgi:hypothetical protein
MSQMLKISFERPDGTLVNQYFGRWEDLHSIFVHGLFPAPDQRLLGDFIIRVEELHRL